MAKFVVTGASGFVGSALVLELIAQGHTVLGVSRTAVEFAQPEPRYRHATGDLANWNELALSPDEDYDVLIHLAWAGSGGADRSDVGVQMANVLMAENAVQLALTLGCKRFVGVGTVTEEELDFTHFDGVTKPSPGFLYGAAKQAADQVTRFAAATRGLEHVWVRLGNAYGPQDTSGRFLISTLHKLLAGEEASVSAGTQNYDFVFLSDAADGLIRAGLSGKPDSRYYLGSGEQHRLRWFLETIGERSGRPELIKYGSASPGVSLPLEKFSIEELHQDTGYTPRVPFSKGIDLLIAEARG